ncbi:MAG: HD domain-containing protein [Desulfomonilaceae bacterium]
MILSTIPDEEDCISLLQKYDTPDHIIMHSRKVWEVGKLIGNKVRRHCEIDMALLRASCLLHDIGKYPSIVEGKKFHDIVGEQILVNEGLSMVGNIIVQHVVLRSDFNVRVAEEHVLFYADKRVVHDNVVSLDDRFVYLIDTYGRNAEAIKRLLEMKQETKRVEEAIFAYVDFSPEDIISLI